MRYWTGLLLATRTGLSIYYSIVKDSEDSITLIIISSALVILVFIPCSGYKIYENKYLNLLEATFILNLIFLAGAAYMVKQTQRNSVSYISAGVAFAEFLFIIFYHFHISLMRLKVYKVSLEIILKKSVLLLTRKPKAVYSQELQSTPEVQSTFVDMREPLLEETIP